MATSSTDPQKPVHVRSYPLVWERRRGRGYAGLLLFSVALLVRLAVAAPFLHYSIALDDMLQYDMLARSLIAGNGYRWYSQADLEANRPYLEQFMDYSKLKVPPEGVRTTFRPPGYPFFLAGLYLFFPPGSRWVYARLIQCALGASLAPLAALLALRMGFNRRTAWLSGFGMALYPILLMYPIALASENVFIPLFILSILAILWSARSSSLRRPAFAGVVMGLAVLTRSVVSPVAFIASLWIARFSPAKWRGALVFFAAAFGICLPWAVRNSLLTGRPAFVETSLGYQMYIGYHPAGDGGFSSDIAVRPLNIIDDSERDRYCRQQVIDFIRNDPLDALKRMAKRAVYFFGVEDRELLYFYTNDFFGPIAQPWLSLLYLTIILPWPVLCIFSTLGGSQIIQRPAILLAAGFSAGYVIPHLLVIAEPRFHLALVPMLMPIATWGWIQGRYFFKAVIHPKRQHRARAGLAAAALAILFVLWGWGFIQRWDSLMAVLSVGGNTLRWFY